VYVNASRPRRNPLFFVDLLADVQGIHYSTPLQNFETVLVSLFDKGIMACQSVPQLEKVDAHISVLQPSGLCLALYPGDPVPER